MPKLLLNYRILEALRSERCKYPQYVKTFYRKMITQETPGVYRFGPDLNSLDETKVIDRNVNGSTDEVINTFGDVYSAVPSTLYYERPTPVIFVSGEALSADM